MGSTALEERIFDATLNCVARWGIAKSTLDDIAREAGCGRATIYRTFHGGKHALVGALAQRERSRLCAAVEAAFDEAETLEDLLVAGLTSASRFLSEHQAFQFLLAHEPDSVLPWFAFAGLDTTFRAAEAFATPHLARFLPADAAEVAAEWAARVLISYLLVPRPGVDIRDEADARRLVRTFVLPGLRSASATGA